MSSHLARKTFMKNWFAVEVCGNFLLSSVSVWIRSGIECFDFSTAGCPDVSPLVLLSLPFLLDPQAKEGGRHRTWAFGGLVVQMRSG